MACKRKLSGEEAIDLILSSFKGEIPLPSLCRHYGVSVSTYYRLRNRFLKAGIAGLRMGKVPETKVLEDRIKELEKALGRKAFEVEILRSRKDD
ncbi:MAG: helix-turn-helix domain-containing protein [Ignavibacteria bacterium]